MDRKLSCREGEASSSAAQPADQEGPLKQTTGQVALSSAAQPASTKGRTGGVWDVAQACTSCSSAEQPALTSSWADSDLGICRAEQPDASMGVPKAFDIKHYAGVASRRPVFIPPADFFVPQPQEWTQRACANQCIRCVYDGASLCEGCEDHYTKDQAKLPKQKFLSESSQES